MRDSMNVMCIAYIQETEMREAYFLVCYTTLYMYVCREWILQECLAFPIIWCYVTCSFHANLGFPTSLCLFLSFFLLWDCYWERAIIISLGIATLLFAYSFTFTFKFNADTYIFIFFKKLFSHLLNFKRITFFKFFSLHFKYFYTLSN